VLELQNVTCHYGKVAAVRNLSMHINQGELVSLIGGNGAGKSTTLKAISGLIRPTNGRIFFKGEDITTASPKTILSKGIAHCPEGRHVFPDMTVEENLEMGCYLRSDRDEIQGDMEVIYSRFPRLKERQAQMAGTLSGGEQQMLAIGRALMSRPQLLLFDEPSLGLAPNLVKSTFQIISEIRERGMTVLLVEQNAYSALEMCDRSYILESGEMRLSGTGKQLLDNPEVKAAYLGV
jgi:branched-chain amino acid transport system ATP-binding protein